MFLALPNGIFKQCYRLLLACCLLIKFKHKVVFKHLLGFSETKILKTTWVLQLLKIIIDALVTVLSSEISGGKLTASNLYCY